MLVVVDVVGVVVAPGARLRVDSVLRDEGEELDVDDNDVAVEAE